MKFYMNAYNSEHGESYSGIYEYPCVRLITDGWDDYEYETLFRAQLFISENEVIWLGKIKILNSNFKKTRKAIESEFENLNEEFCSLGQTIEYYRCLKEIRESGRESISEDILTSLNDIAYDKEKERKFIDKFSSSGIYVSLTRDSEAYHVYLFGHSIYFNIRDNPNNESEYLNFEFSCKLHELKEPHVIKFDFSKKDRLSNRINVLVGKNGTGKTKILSSLAGYLSGKKKIDDSVKINNRPFFSRYIAISYSAFDNFNFIAETNHSKKTIVNTLKTKMEEAQKIFNDITQYIEKQEQDEPLNVYNKFAKEIYDKIDLFKTDYAYLNELIDLPENEIVKNEDNDMTENRLFSYVYCGLKSNNKVISDGELLNNFIESYRYIKKKNRGSEWKEILFEIIEQKSVIDQISSLEENFSDYEIKMLFDKFSSGQKITVYIFTEVIENITEKSFLLIDEPEIHLHPNAISNFMRMINKILEKFDSYAVIATHSPLILQEIPSRNVKVFDSFEGNIPSVDKLYNECFGENVSNIISYTFKVDPKESNYKSILRELRKEGLSIEEIINLFDNKLSYNAQIYLNSLLDEIYNGDVTK